MAATTKEWADKVVGGFKFVFHGVYKRVFKPIPRKRRQRTFGKGPAEMKRAAKRRKIAEDVARERFANMQPVVPAEQAVRLNLDHSEADGGKVPESGSDAPESVPPSWTPCRDPPVERVPEPAFQGTPHARKISHLKRKLDLGGKRPGDDVFNEGVGSARLPTIREELRGGEAPQRGTRKQARGPRMRVTPRRSPRLSTYGQNVASLTPPRPKSRESLLNSRLGSGRSVNKTHMPWIP